MLPDSAHFNPAYLFGALIFLVVCFFALLAVTLLLQDSLLIRLHSNHREIWEALGCPRGWLLPRLTFPHVPANNYATLSFDYYRSSEPVWLNHTPELRADYQRVRRGMRYWAFIALPTMVVAFFLCVLVCELHK